MATAAVPKPVPKPARQAASFDSTLASARTSMMFSQVVALAIDSFRASKVRFLLRSFWSSRWA
jgi:putative ABC transport system permease protein